MQWFDESAKEAYELLIANGSPVKLDTYCEKHHIVPRSLGGSDDAENLVYLTAGEHLYAHYWLWVGTGEHDMALAYFQMSNSRWSKFDETPLVTDAMVQAYESAKIIMAKAQSERGKRQVGDKNPMYGRTGDKNPMYGRTGEMCPSYGRTGDKNPMYGKKRPDRSEMNKSQIGANHPRSKTVIQTLECGKQIIYGSGREASRVLGTHQTLISKWARKGKNGFSYAANNDVSTTGDI